MPNRAFIVLALLIVIGLAGRALWLEQNAPPDLASNSDEIAPPYPAEAVLNLRTSSFALALHPLKMVDVESRQIAALLHAGLIFQDDTGDVRPLLAESWIQTGNEWRFHLREDVTFSDGTPVSLSDVITSICNAMQPASPWAWALVSIQQEIAEDGKTVKCTGLDAIGESTIRIVEQQPSNTLLDALSGPAGWILKRNATEQPYGVVPGIGPFKVKQIVADNRIVLEARTGAVSIPGVETVRFNFIADDSVAASQFLTGQIDVLDLTSPQLVDMVIDASSQTPKGGGTLVRRNWDRVRILIINKQRLAERGFTDSQQRTFIDAYASAIDRQRLAAIAKGTALPLTSPFPPVPDIVPPEADPGTLPSVNLSILTEPDAYSDLLASSLPRTLGGVRTDYRGVDKAVLIDSLIKGDYDLALMVIEATVHSAQFWLSIFTPGNPFVVFGTPIEEVRQLDVRIESDLQKAGELIITKGNWIGLLHEQRLQAVQPGISGILFSASGQTNYSFASKQ